MVMSAFGEGGRWALCICCVFGLQMISETRRTSVVTHFMSTVRAYNLCPMDQTIWQCFESEFAINYSFLHFLSRCFSPNANPASTFSDSLSYSSAALWIKTSGDSDGHKSNNVHSFVKKIYAVKRMSREREINALTLTALINVIIIMISVRY